jgi:hypothetical protein
MDQAIRNHLQRATQDARRLLESEFAAQLEGTFDILPDGTILPEPGSHLNDRQQLVRHKIVEAIEHIRLKNAGKTTAQALDDYLREAAFTFLNRFAALKMMEARGLVQQCVTKGDQSSGFKEFIGLAPGLSSLPDKGYQLYLECLFDELGTEINQLFDRRDSASLVWPRRQALLDLLDILNREALQGIWGEDETIGWVYQYFNSQEERKEMRDESAAPRNSRELAVRNQFFTPRYVVEFLTDNTLGRIWYEMTQGQTALKDSCRYLVRRPNEIFLKEGEQLPAQDEVATGLSQEELLKQPVHIPFRVPKDPRDIKMLDPACGSMHFGLYAFDLFERIYEEAWDMQASGGWRVIPGHATDHAPLTTDYPTKETLLRDVPRLIIENNIHGIDIDPRAVQIAGLSLWLRAQKSWQSKSIRPHDRPRISRSTIACAEPMPGEPTYLEEFIAQHLSGSIERQFLASLVRKVFSSMKLAGELGSLLQIEVEIADEVAKAKRAWLERPDFKQRLLFAVATKPEQQELDLTRGITDASFWDGAERMLYDALAIYSEQAEQSGGYQRRLFAADAARGFAFIDLCRQRFDVIVMNPPFGEPVDSTQQYLKAQYTEDRNEIIACFLVRVAMLTANGGMLGAISSRTVFFNTFCEHARRTCLFENAQLSVLIDLGWRVLDGAAVEAAAYCACASANTTAAIAIRVLRDADRESSILRRIQSLANGSSPIDEVFITPLSLLHALPHCPLAYWMSPTFLTACRSKPSLAASGVHAMVGLSSADNFRYLRLAWEPAVEDIGPIGAKKPWVPLVKGGEYNPMYDDIHLLLMWERDGLELLHSPSATVRGAQYYGKPGGTYPYRTASGFCVRLLPTGCAFSDGGHGLVPDEFSDEQMKQLAAYCHTRVPRAVLEVYLGEGGATSAEGAARNYVPRAIEEIPMPSSLDIVPVELASEWTEQMRRPFLSDETSREFSDLPIAHFTSTLRDGVRSIVREDEMRAAHLLIKLEDIDRAVGADFRLAKSDKEFLDEEFGPLITDFPTDRGVDRDLFSDLYTCDKDRLTNKAMEVVGARRFTAKKMYWVSRRIELLSRVFARHPSVITQIIEEEGICNPLEQLAASTALISLALGASFGRWDIRFFTGEKPTTALSDVFAELPTCPPAMLKNDQGVPLTEGDQRRLQDAGGWNYPIDIPWRGILVDDPGHPLDIEARVQQVLRIIWRERWEAIEHEVCQMLGVNTVREYFRKPALFFGDHLKRYSKSRRQAPIYWPLTSSGGGYTIWIYYHRFRRDTVALAVEEAKKKLQHEYRKLDDLRHNAGPNPTRSQREEIEPQEMLVSEISGFVEELGRVAPLWKPHLNDGVIINYAPLWRLIGHTAWRKSVKECWDSLCTGDCDWAHLAIQLWPERVIPKCQKDVTLAIAHGLVDDFWEKDDRDRLVKKPAPPSGWQPVIDMLVAERTSSAVKAALDSLLNAPPLTGAGGGRRGSRSATAPRRTRAVSPEETSDAATPIRSRSRTSAPTTDVETLELVKNVIAAATDGASKTDVLAATGLSAARWTAAIHTLLQQGSVTKTGERRGTRYHIAEGVGVNDSPTADESEGQE